MIVLSRTIRIDWSRVIANLQRSGMSVRQIADEVDASKSQIDLYGDEHGTTEPAHCVELRTLHDRMLPMQRIPEIDNGHEIAENASASVQEGRIRCPAQWVLR
jgi:hypothetical protein